MSENENQDTRESPAISPEDVAAAAAPAAESAPADAPAPPADAPAAPADAPAAPPEEVSFSLREDTGADHAGGGQSPAAGQERAESGDQSPLERPEVQILGAFVGAFVLAKLLQRLFSRD
ncbi:MAG: hypothetical protein QOE06_3466 [Thermoleophilaceae bacterium]|nr:hypothetical protein [Thermoleophilaceae bacterium]